MNSLLDQIKGKEFTLNIELMNFESANIIQCTQDTFPRMRRDPNGRITLSAIADVEIRDKHNVAKPRKFTFTDELTVSRVYLSDAVIELRARFKNFIKDKLIQVELESTWCRYVKVSFTEEGM